MTNRARNAVFPLVAGAILVVTAVISGVTLSGQDAELAAQARELDNLTSKVEAARAGTGGLEKAASLSSTGADADRVKSDTELIRELVERTLTWDSHESYNEARASTMRVYDLAEDSVFMTSFLPEAPVNRDSQGNEYPYIDAAGLNSAVGDFTADLVSVDGLVYSYMVLVAVQASSSDGLGSATNAATMFVTIDGDGGLSNITGFASTTSPRTSG